jgi:hypothetical protein
MPLITFAHGEAEIDRLVAAGDSSRAPPTPPSSISESLPSDEQRACSRLGTDLGCALQGRA